MRLVSLLISVLIALPTQAQTVRADSGRAPVVVQRTSSGVAGVRERIRAIHGRPQRVVQPVIFMVSPPAPPSVSPLTADERQALDAVRPGLANRVQTYYDFYRSYAPPMVVNLPPSVPAVPTPLRADSVLVDTLRDAGGFTPPARPATVQPLPRVPVASVREVERAILETGLFRAVGINFEFDESTLLDGAEVLLDPVGEVLRRYPNLVVEVGGHTDNVGADGYNERLSQARAETVRQYLVTTFGLDGSRLVARGYGESRPLVTNDNPTGRTLNRRVEFTVLAR